MTSARYSHGGKTLMKHVSIEDVLAFMGRNCDYCSKAHECIYVKYWEASLTHYIDERINCTPDVHQ